MVSDELVFVDGWKGKSGLKIIERPKHYIVQEWRKDKESGESKVAEHKVDWVLVANLKLVVEQMDLGTEYKYKYVVRKIIQHYNLVEEFGLPEDVLLETFNGGKFRKKAYFKYYYYPVKILESKGVIQYLGRGGIIRLK